MTTTVGEIIAIKYRGRDEILRSILQYASETEEIGKTRIMYHSLLSYPQLNEYLNYLLKNELLHHNIGSNRYKITDKGLKSIESLYQNGRNGKNQVAIALITAKIECQISQILVSLFMAICFLFDSWFP